MICLVVFKLLTAKGFKWCINFQGLLHGYWDYHLIAPNVGEECLNSLDRMDCYQTTVKHRVRTMHMSLQWCHNERDCVSNHQRVDCLLNLLWRRRSKKPQKAPHHRPLRRKSISDQWIALKRTVICKMFHLMTPLCRSMIQHAHVHTHTQVRMSFQLLF